MKSLSLTLIAAAALAAAGCGDENGMMSGPTGVGPMPLAAPGFMSVSPGGGAMGVALDGTLQFRWGVGMGVGMEQLIDLHLGDLAGPTAPMSCGWSADRTTLSCTPNSPLQPGTQYTIHIGGAMLDANGQVVDLESYGPGFGGQWIQGGMMGGFHAGAPWGGMGNGWQHTNGAYGMAFTFTTA